MESDLKARMRSDLDDARRKRDRFRTVLLTTMLSDVRNREIDKRGELTRADLIEVVSRAVKQRKESAEQMRQADRDELAEKEEREAEILSTYLPEPLTEGEVRGMVREAIESGANDVGPVMGRIMPRLRGRFDGSEANRIVREELAG